jgi:hypothetical protein
VIGGKILDASALAALVRGRLSAMAWFDTASRSAFDTDVRNKVSGTFPIVMGTIDGYGPATHGPVPGLRPFL